MRVTDYPFNPKLLIGKRISQPGMEPRWIYTIISIDKNNNFIVRREGFSNSKQILYDDFKSLFEILEDESI
jgi:hypothetical protein